MMKKSYSFGFVIDPIEGFNPAAETTLFLMAEAQKRGHRIFTFTLPGLFYERGTLYGRGSEIKILGINRIPFYRTLRQVKIDLAQLQVLFLRKDPPFDLAYLHHLYLLGELRGKVFMVNDPLTILEASEKIFPLGFSEYTPSTCVTRSFEEVHRFSKGEAKGIILKPINSSGGRGVFYLKPGDSNLKIVFELLSQEGEQYVLCQSYLPQVQEEGDKRVMLLHGEILGFFLRVPRRGEHRANLHSGGSLKKCGLTKREREIACHVGKTLKEMGLYFVGLDLIGEHLTEINVTSPMGLREINVAQGGHSERKVIDFVEEQIESL